jgi:hypothetical protein
MTIRILVIFLFLASPAFAANHHIRPNSTADATYGCANNGDGSTWACASGAGATGAFNAWPAHGAYVRGDTYFASTGVHAAGPGYFDTAVSGAAIIYIKKATTAVHGSDTGWDNSYGTGQAVLNWSASSINTSYWDFDGVVGAGSMDTDYGFKITPSAASCAACSAAYIVGVPNTGYGSTTPNNVSLKHIAIEGCGEGDGTCCTIGMVMTTHTGTTTGLNISNNYFSGGQNAFMIIATDTPIISNNYFADSWSSATCHGEMTNFKTTSNAQIFNNIFRGWAGYAIGVHLGTSDGVPPNSDFDVYNNIFDGTGVASQVNPVIGSADSAHTNVMVRWNIHHNTFLNITTSANVIDPYTVSDVPADNSIAYNNLFYNMNKATMTNHMTHDYNLYIDVSTYTAEANAQTATGNPFVNSAAGNYHLLAHTAAGTTLSSPFNVDFAGVSRANFDRGAYEYAGGGPIAYGGIKQCRP